MLIYKITNDINSKLYIGQTTKTLEERIKSHRNSFVSGKDTHLYRAMRKYGWEKFHFHTIAEVNDQETLNELEAFYIAKYDTIRNGYNMARGGNINIMYSDVIRQKHDDVMRSPEVRDKISKSMKRSYELRGGQTPEHRAHLFKLSETHFRALNDAKNKAVYCIDESGNFVAEFPRVKDAALWWQTHGYDTAKYVRNVCDQIKKSAKFEKYIRGLRWFYRV